MSKLIIERKFVPLASELKLEKRDGSTDVPDIVGYSALFDSETVIQTYWGDGWREVIRKGFFSAAIKDKQDVRALFNHDPNFVLGRSTSPKKTLQLKEDKTGLLARISPPNNTIGRDVVESIERGDISGQSFAFTLASEKWTKGDRKKGELDLRELIAVDTLYDVGPVTYPAFEETDISVDRAAAFAQFNCRARAFEQFGESMPREVLKDFSNRSQFVVPSTFDISGSELRTMIREEVKQALSEEKHVETDDPKDPPPPAEPAEPVTKPETEPVAEPETEPETQPDEEAERQANRRIEMLRLERISLNA